MDGNLEKWLDKIEKRQIELLEWKGQQTAKLNSIFYSITDIQRKIDEIHKNLRNNDIRTAKLAGEVAIISSIIVGVIVSVLHIVL